MQKVCFLSGNSPTLHRRGLTVLATSSHWRAACDSYEARIVSLLLPAVKIVSQLTKTHHFDNDTSAKRCRCQRRRPLPPPPPGSPSNDAPPLPPCRPYPDAPTSPLGAPRRTMRRSHMTCRGCCTTVRGKARSTTSGSYWMSGPGGGSTLRAPMSTRGSCGCSSPAAPRMSRQMGPGTQARRV